MGKIRTYGYWMAMLWLAACEQPVEKLPSVEERKAAASAALQAELTAPANGWRLNYKPTAQAGTFLILLDFNDDGTVRIRSDVPANNGEFLDDTLTYRIDHDLATELILETYGVFHYLFELNQNSFGAEFEFLYKGKDGDDLLFESKTDVTGDQTTLSFVPAGATDVDLISTQIISQLATGGFRQGERAGIGANVIYQLYLPGDNVSVFTSLDLGNRRAKVHGASVGYTFGEVSKASQSVRIQTVTDMAFVNEEVLFESPITFSLAGKNYSFSSIAATNFQELDTIYCDQNDTYTAFNTTSAGLGSGEMRSSLYTNFSDFFDGQEEFYSIPTAFLYDANDSSLANTISTQFENASIFLLIYNALPRGYTGTGTFTGVGFAGFDASNRIQWYLREMNIVSRKGNYLEVELLDGTFINVADSLAEREALFELTDRIFEGGAVYGTEVLSFEDLFEVYNPCSGYQFFVFE